MGCILMEIVILFYKQIFGTPMSLPLSPIIAEIVLQNFEVQALEKLFLQLSLYYKYIDDIILAALSLITFKLHFNIFNSMHERLQNLH